MEKKLCDFFRLCDTPMWWFDDHENTRGSWFSKAGSWRQEFTDWIRRLPAAPFRVPSETTREKLKREYKERLRRAAEEKAAAERQMSERLVVLETQLQMLREAAAADGEAKKELIKEIKDLKEGIKNIGSSFDVGGCFSGDSTVAVRG